MIEDKLRKFREVCRGRTFCEGCRYEDYNCVLYNEDEDGFYPSDWDDSFIEFIGKISREEI